MTMSLLRILKFSLLAVLFFCSHTFGDPLNHWKNLLHYYNEKSMVESDSFFLNLNGATDYEAELKTTIDLINSEKGDIITCNFPARYSWLKSQGYPVRSINLNRCRELKEFVDNFQKGTVSIVFASENIDSAASVFGHLILVFKDADKPLLTADAIQFAAEVGKDSFIKYAYKGMTGGYDGYFVRSPFFAIKNNYTVCDQRVLHVFELDLSQEQILNLIYHLYELRKARFKYYFIKQNCAYQVASLLDIAYKRHNRNNSLYVLPIDIINAYENKVTNMYAIEPSIMRGQRLIDLMLPIERRQFNFFQNGKGNPNEIESDKVKEVLAIHREYMFRRYRKILPDYNEISGLTYCTSPSPFKTLGLNEETPRNKTNVGYYHSRDVSGLYIQYLPVGRDIFENQFESLHETQLKVLNTELVVDQDTKLHLQKVDFLSAKSMLARSELSPNLSWDMTFGINRDNSLNETTLDFSYSAGKAFATNRFGVSCLIGLGAQDNTREGVFYVKPSIDIVYYPMRSLKFYASLFSKCGVHGYYNQLLISANKQLGNIAVLGTYLVRNSIADEAVFLSFRFSF